MRYSKFHKIQNLLTYVAAIAKKTRELQRKRTFSQAGIYFVKERQEIEKDVKLILKLWEIPQHTDDVSSKLKFE